MIPINPTPAQAVIARRREQAAGLDIRLVDEPVQPLSDRQHELKAVKWRRWHLIDVNTTEIDISIWQLLWGADIFVNGWPVLKIFVGVGLLVVWAIV